MSTGSSSNSRGHDDMNTEESKMNVFQALIKHEPHFLDRPLADLLPMRFMGEVAVNAYRGLIRHLNDLPLSLEEKESRLKDGQDAGKALLMIEERIGKLLPTAEEAERGAIKQRGIPWEERKRSGAPKVLPEGISSKQAYHARAIASHPAEVAEAIREAEENEDIPTKTAVLNKIAYKRELERVKGTREKTQLEMRADAFIYFSKLQEAARLIPAFPPKQLNEKDLNTIRALALSIIKKLEVFQNGKTTESLRITG
jgi:hypothetical protein